MRVVGHRVLIADIATPRIWKVAVLTAAGAIGTASRADATLYYYSDPGTYYQQEAQPPRKPQQRARRAAPKKSVVVKDTTVHPQMPLVIAVSIQKQQVKIYDANGFFAEAPVSTGMPGHPTPMGVFSVIEKDRYHHSNIYSGAPMPFMQRITWSGVAMHAGVLPGYPASHGCIRMPESFAIKMWGWTKMGARVIVTPGEISMPAGFTHPLLPAMKVVPQPPVAETDDPVGTKADKGAPEVSEDKLELRPTVGHAEITPVTLRDQTHTADASGDGSDLKSAVTMSDAPKVAAKADTTPSTSADPANHATVAEAKTETKAEAKAKPKKSATAEVKPDVTAKAESKSGQVEAAAKPDGESAKPEDTGPAKVEEKPAETRIEAAKPKEKAAPVKVAEVEPATAPKVEAKEDAPKKETPKAEPAEADTPKAEVKTDVVPKAEVSKAEPAKIEPAKAGPAKANEKPAEPAKAAPVADTTSSGPKDQTRITLPAAKQPKRREGQIAVFISRKDSKLYVRQNFAPLFDVPVTIAASDRPLGTHIFTAEVDKNDSNLLHWSVVTVPSRAAAIRDEPRMTRTKKGKLVPAPVEAKPAPAVDTPAEALDRITIPADMMARIVDALTTGGSIIVSDQGINQGETGEGTDFIVSLR
jgi:lipoprotein-anchoring transpeptidase ErfK/SrfK